MFERLKKAIAPSFLWATSMLLRGNLLGPVVKDALWTFAQKYSAYFDITTEALLVNGMKVAVSSQPRVEQEIFLFGEWEPLFTRYIRDLDAKDLIFLDIGANIGYFSLLASSIFGEVHSIEASPSTGKRLQKNVLANGIESIFVYEVAVGDDEGHIDFYQDSRQSGAASTIKSGHSVFEARVPVARLETILKAVDWKRVRLIKVDVEGSEAPVLDSIFRLQDSLYEGVEIFVEFDPDHSDTWPSISVFLENGFTAHILQGPYDRQDYIEPGRRTQLKAIDRKPLMFCDLLLRRNVH
ncbi:MAG: FkbM family methyltransferase [Pseudomonadota bacterium]